MLRKFKQLKRGLALSDNERKYPNDDCYTAVLQCLSKKCMHGDRASDPCRKAIEVSSAPSDKAATRKRGCTKIDVMMGSFSIETNAIAPFPSLHSVQEMAAHDMQIPPQVLNQVLRDLLGSSYYASETDTQYTNPSNLDAALAIVDALQRSDLDKGENRAANTNVDEDFWPDFVRALIKDDR